MFGQFDTVMVEWQIFQYNSTDGSLQSIPSQQDFSAVAGVLQFAPSVSEQSIQLDLLRDGLPELEEMFAVRLIRTTGGTPGARLGSPTTTNLTVPENDDPYGVFRFTPTSERVEIGEPLLDQTAVIHCSQYVTHLMAKSLLVGGWNSASMNFL